MTTKRTSKTAPRPRARKPKSGLTARREAVRGHLSIELSRGRGARCGVPRLFEPVNSRASRNFSLTGPARQYVNGFRFSRYFRRILRTRDTGACSSTRTRTLTCVRAGDGVLRTSELTHTLDASRARPSLEGTSAVVPHAPSQQPTLTTRQPQAVVRRRRGAAHSRTKTPRQCCARQSVGQDSDGANGESSHRHGTTGDIGSAVVLGRRSRLEGSDNLGVASRLRGALRLVFAAVLLDHLHHVLVAVLAVPTRRRRGGRRRRRR